MLGTTIPFLVLANSCKHGGRCVAGKVMTQGRLGAWVRPTGTGAEGALRDVEQRLPNGRLPAVLDVVEVPLLQPAPVGHQTENRRISRGMRWRLRGRWPSTALHQAVDPCESLWLDGDSSTGGENDRVPAWRLGALDDSLRLIGPVAVTLRVIGVKVRARFCYRRTWYDLSLTDPVLKAAFAARAEGLYPLGHSYVCVSLAPVWNGYAYKLAAAVIPATQGHLE